MISAYSIGQIVIFVIIIAAIIGIGLVAVRASGVAIPSWATTILWILLIAVLAILAIRFLMGMA